MATYNPGTLKGAHAKTPLRAAEIISEARGLQLNLVAIQETRLVGDEVLEDLPGNWQFVGTNRRAIPNSNRNPGGGVGWLMNLPKVFEATHVERPSSIAGAILERSWLRLTCASGILFFGCLYWPPGGKVDQFRKDMSLLREDLTALSALGTVAILGDLNARLPSALSPTPCSRGRLLAPLLEDFGLYVCNKREATHNRGPSRSLIDYPSGRSRRWSARRVSRLERRPPPRLRSASPRLPLCARRT